MGEIIIDRAIETEATLMQGVGVVETLIDEESPLYNGEYMPLLKYPLEYVSKYY